MGQRQRRAGTGVGGGELIPALSPARRARVAVALAALALDIGLGALVATDADSVSGLAWSATAVSLMILAAGLVVASSGTVQVSVSLLAALLLLRHQDRLVLAPLYGACLLLIGELAQRSLELRGRERVGAGVVAARLAAVLVLAALGACGAAVAAIGVTLAPTRSVGFTAVGTIAVLAAVAAILMLARRQHPEVHGDPTVSDAPGERR